MNSLGSQSSELIAGKYRLDGVLGEGGMGRVFLATQVALGRKVAIKELHPELGKSVQERFSREAMSLARLQHPSIVTIFEFVQDVGKNYIVSEYVDGYNLDTLMANDEVMPLRESLQISLDISTALFYTHEHGLVHRDIKPANILIDKHTGKAKLSDFGIALQLSNRRITQADTPLGSPVYMAPEAIRTPQSVDARSDIYSLGVTFYELFTGSLPFSDAESDFDLKYMKIFGEKPINPASIRRDLPSKLSDLIESMMERDLEKRTFSMAIVIAILEEVLRELPPETQSIRPMSTGRPSITSRIGSLAAAPTPSFFARTQFSQTSFFQDGAVRFSKIQESLIFYRDHLNAEYGNLLRQARFTYYLWLLCVSIGFILLIGSVVAMLMGRIQEGLASSVVTLVVFFIQRIFQQREDHYRALAKAKNEHLEYGNQWLLVIQSIDGIEDEKNRALQQAKLVEVLLRKLKKRKVHLEEPAKPGD